MARYGLSGLVQRLWPLTNFPFGTIVVNLLGCFVTGMITGILESRQFFGIEVRMFFIIGVLGGFTTFSTFSYETLMLIRGGEYLHAVTNVIIHVILGVTFVWFGYGVAT